MFLKLFRKAKPVPNRQTGSGESMNRTTDAVAAYRATGDLAILGELYEPYMEMIYAVCYNYLRDEEEAKDAVMNLFEQLVVDLRRHEVQQFGPWLHSVARNYCLMQLRKNQAHPTVALASQAGTEQDDAPMLAVVDDDHDQTELEENLVRMEVYLQQLPAEQQMCLTLFYLEHKSYYEVAERTGFDLKQVKSYLQNGRRNLKICMSK